MDNKILETFEKRPRRLKSILLMMVPLVIVLVWSASFVDYNGIERNGFIVIQSIPRGLIKPNWNIYILS